MFDDQKLKRLKIFFQMPAQYTTGNKAKHLLRTTSGRSINLRSEKERLKTFSDWPASNIDPRELAKSGFYYTKTGDEIRCAFCGLQMSQWQANWDPTHLHRENSVECDFINERDCGNIPLMD